MRFSLLAGCLLLILSAVLVQAGDPPRPMATADMRVSQPATERLPRPETKAQVLGKPAPDLVGADLAGKPMRLSEYRGKVVLVTFWASWCGQCLFLLPHERDLARRLAGRPFAVVGVNGDKDLAAAAKTATDKGITWRSFRDRREPGSVISQEWGIAFWPTLYLIDHTGVIRKRWVGAPAVEVLGWEVERLVVAAERGKVWTDSSSRTKKGS